MIIYEATAGPQDSRLYKFYVAYLINELHSRHIKDHNKKEQLDEHWYTYKDQKARAKEERRRNNRQAGKKDDSESSDVDIGYVKKQDFFQYMKAQLGYFEAERFRIALEREHPESQAVQEKVIFKELSRMYYEDEKFLMSEAFERLSLGEDTLVVDHILHGLYVNDCTHKDQIRKALNGHLIEEFKEYKVVQPTESKENMQMASFIKIIRDAF